MTAIKHKTRHDVPASFRGIVIFSAWGFVLAIASFLFLWLGYLLDELLGTTPKFMLVLFLLAIVGCFVELYQEILKIIKNT